MSDVRAQAPPSFIELVADGLRFLFRSRAATLFVALSLLQALMAELFRDNTALSLAASLAIAYLQLVVTVAMSREAITGEFVITKRDSLSALKILPLLLGALLIAAAIVFAPILLLEAGAYWEIASVPTLALFAIIALPLTFMAAALSLDDGFVPARLWRQAMSCWPICLGLALLSFLPTFVDDLGFRALMNESPYFFTTISGLASAVFEMTAIFAVAFLYVRYTRSIA